MRPAVSAVDPDALLERVDVENLIERIDVDALITRVDLNALLERIDVDALMARIDIDALMSRVDIDGLMGRVDIDGLMGRVDVDGLVGRVDIDGLIDRVDLPALVSRAGIDDIVSEAATGMATKTLDLVRRQLVGIDLVLLGLVDRLLRRPRLGTGAVAGRPAGPISRLAAFALDWMILTLVFGITVSVGVSLVELVTRVNINTRQGGELGWGLAFVGWAFMYFWVSLAVAGRTVAKAIVGLRVVSKDRSALRPLAGAVRTLCLPVSCILGLGLIPAVVGRNRRALHDLVSGTQEVVDWGLRDASMPSPLARWLDTHGAADGPR